MLWLSNGLCLKLCGIASACCRSHCITPPYPAALCSQTVCWERNKYYFVLDWLCCFFYFSGAFARVCTFPIDCRLNHIHIYHQVVRTSYTTMRNLLCWVVQKQGGWHRLQHGIMVTITVHKIIYTKYKIINVCIMYCSQAVCIVLIPLKGI